ncbi:MAG TPA: outer membrane protein assembly factor BamD [Terriglobales bacterium]|jgi:outer membrane protein assembly factor BamD
MSRRSPVLILLALLLVLAAACTNKKVNNPLANVGSKQPDKVLFDRAMDAMKHNRFDVARMTLQTLVNTYPESEYIARAKLAEGDSWYAEGGTTALTQAELVYKDFITFFPNMPEAAEAQLKIANIHYQQMEKPDRDFTHAMRAEDEYRQLISQFPDSKLVPEAKQRLLEVQEVLAQREFMIGRFYFMRQSHAAAIARLQSVVNRYPLFSQADEAYYMLGQSYEGQITNIRASKLDEVRKARLIKDYTNKAAEAYSTILKRYPVMTRAEDATKRLQALHQPVPQASKEAIAQNQKEEDSRHSSGMFGHMLGQFNRHPDVAAATKVGEPTLVDPQPVSATDIVQAANRALAGTGSGGSGENRVSIETLNGKTPPPNEPAPRSDTATDNSAGSGTPSSNAAQVPIDSTAPPPEENGIPELKPNVTDSNAGEPLPPPSQVNEIQTQPADAAAGSTSSTASSSSSKAKDDDPNVSSSKKKKKKHKLFPF